MESTTRSSGSTVSRRRFVQLLGAGAATAAMPRLAFGEDGPAATKRKPNFVLIFVDDMGYGDLGCFGNEKIRTPSIDRMASEGLKLTSFYVASSICTPSRAALLTGCYPRRVGLGAGVIFPRHSKGLSADEITIAELLKDQGYATACIGKWHLGHEKPFLPTRQGFDTYYGIPYSNDMHHKFRGSKGVPLMRDDQVIEQPADQATLTKRYTEQAVRFIEQHRDEPFFVYLPHTMPHIPLAASDKFRGQSKRGLYGDVIEELDWSVGQVLATLKRLGLDDDTLVVLTSDNGPWKSKGERGGSSGPLRGGKFSAWEGGYRVPCVMRWPGTIAKNTTSPTLATTMDILPTFAALAGATPPNDRTIDGHDIHRLLRNPADAQTPYEAFFYHTSNGKLAAVRNGDWKLHLKKGELYHLDRDVGETTNVAADHPRVVDRLRKLAEAFEEEIAANARPVGQYTGG